MKYIDADLLRKDIEFAKSVYDNPKRVVHGVADAFRQDGRAAMCDDILAVIDAMEKDQQGQQEEPDKSLEEAAYKYSFDSRPSIYGQVDVIDAFKAGAKWQKEQIMKDAVEGYVNYYEDSGGILMAEAQVGCPYHNGDKVRIVVLKAEED